MNRTPVVLIHGAWFHQSSWEHWSERFTARGYAVHVLGWPGEAGSAAEGRRRPGPGRDLSLEALIAHHEAVIRTLDSPPVLIGHSLGGLIVQHLFSIGLGRAAVALSPMPRDSPRPNHYQPDRNVPNRDRPNQAHPAPQPPLALPTSPDDEGFFALPPSYFRQAFANTVGEEEAAHLFERHVVPAPRRLMADLGFGAVPDAAQNAHEAHGAHIQRITVDTVTAARGPLLLISGQEDRMIPDAVTRAAYKAYGDSAAVTDLKQFADRGHTLVVDSGWRTVADHVLAWLAANGIEPVDSPA